MYWGKLRAIFWSDHNLTKISKNGRVSIFDILRQQYDSHTDILYSVQVLLKWHFRPIHIFITNIFNSKVLDRVIKNQWYRFFGTLPTTVEDRNF